MKVNSALYLILLISTCPFIKCMEQNIKSQSLPRIPKNYIPSMESEIFKETLEQIKTTILSHNTTQEKIALIDSEVKYLPDYLKLIAQAFYDLITNPQIQNVENIPIDYKMLEQIIISNRHSYKPAFVNEALNFLESNDPVLIGERREQFNRELSGDGPSQFGDPNFAYTIVLLKRAAQNTQRLYDDIVVFHHNSLLKKPNVDVLGLTAAIIERYRYSVDYTIYLESALSDLQNFITRIINSSLYDKRKQWLDVDNQASLKRHLAAIKFFINKLKITSPRIDSIKNYINNVEILFQRKYMTIKDWTEAMQKLQFDFEKSKSS